MDANNGNPPPPPPPHPPHQQTGAPPHGTDGHQMHGYPMDPHWSGAPHMMHHVPMHHMHHQVVGYQGAMPIGGLEGMQFGTIPGVLQMEGSWDPLEVFLGPFPCARLRGLPPDASLEDVLIFLQGLVVLDIVLLEGSKIDRLGEAYVLFANPMDFQMALQRDRQPIRQRTVSVGQARRSDYHVAIAKMQQQGNRENLGGSDVEPGNELKGVAHADTLGNAWSGSTLAVQTLSSQMDGMELGRNNMPGGTANHREHRGNQGHPGGRSGGRGYGGGRGGRGNGGGIQVGEHTGILRMRGLPFTATKKEIAEFFESYKPVESSIVLTYRADGRATGEAYVAFDNPEQSEAAMALNRSSMGTRYIELFISNKEEHSRALARFGGR